MTAPAGGRVPELADIQDAVARVAPYARRTPVHPWDERLGIFLKLESLQPTGSFKVRGAANHLSTVAGKVSGVVTASSGNHGQAVAYVAARLGIAAVVVVPETVTPVKASAITGYGAELVRCGTTMSERYEMAMRLAQERGLHMVPSFDDSLVIAGQGTCGLEILEQVPDLAAVAVPASGGGLLSGVALAIKALRPQVRIIGVEPLNVARFAASRAAGRRVSVPSVDTVADGLRGQKPGELTWEATCRAVDEFVAVDDAAILEAVRRLCVEAHLAVEPSGAISVAALLSGLVKHRPAVAVVSGGNLDPALLASLLTRPG